MNVLFHVDRSSVWRTSFILLILLAIALVCSANDAFAASPGAQLLVKSSPDAKRSSTRQVPLSLLDGAVNREGSPMPASDLYLIVKDQSEELLYGVDAAGNLHLDGRETIVLRPESRSKLMNEARALRAGHYGQLLSWQEASAVIPRKAKLTVIDLETGLRFKAQRRAGSKHADVQPLTKADTDTMKQIYNGKWSWHRRAVLVEANGRVLASSMHGMPHGGDGIPDNGFSGHFCIHFPGSTTHGKGNVDAGHQLMIAKASGTLGTYMNGLDPYDLINAFFLANEYGDRGLMLAIFPDNMHPMATLRHFGVEEAVVRHRFMEPKEIDDAELAVDIIVQTCQARGGRCVNKSLHTFMLRRMSPGGAWKIDGIAADD